MIICINFLCALVNSLWFIAEWVHVTALSIILFFYFRFPKFLTKDREDLERALTYLQTDKQKAVILLNYVEER